MPTIPIFTIKIMTTDGGGKTAQGSGYGTYYTDWNSLVDGSNNNGLCGFSEGWRVPKQHELRTIVHMNQLSLVIDKSYFPVVNQDYNWSSSPSAQAETASWAISFSSGSDDTRARNRYYPVRLVHSGQ